MGRRTPATHRDLIMDPVSRPSHCVKHIRICEFALSAVGFWTSSSKWMKTRELLISGVKMSRSRSPEERDPLPIIYPSPSPRTPSKSQCTHYQVATITASTAHRYPAGIPLNSQARRTHSGLSRFLYVLSIVAPSSLSEEAHLVPIDTGIGRCARLHWAMVLRQLTGC